jgi:hypothetical protein
MGLMISSFVGASRVTVAPLAKRTVAMPSTSENIPGPSRDWGNVGSVEPAHLVLSACSSVATAGTGGATRRPPKNASATAAAAARPKPANHGQRTAGDAALSAACNHSGKRSRSAHNAPCSHARST